MRRGFLIVSTLVIIGAVAGGAWYELRPRDPLAQVRDLMRRGDLHAAQLALRDVVRRHPEIAEAHLRLGITELASSDPVAAEHELRQASQLGADEHAVRPLLAKALAEENNGEAVLRDFTADGLDPQQAADLHIARAIAALQLKRNDVATEEAAAAQRAAPKSADAALNAARVSRLTGDLAGAMRHVDETLALAPHNFPALVLRAELLQRRGDPAATLAAYDAALSDTGAEGANTTPVLLERADLHITLKQDAAARSDVMAALKADPRSPAANYLLAVLEMRARRWKEADEALSQVGPMLDRFSRGDLLQAVIKSNVGEPEQALAAAERFHQRNPEDASGVQLLAGFDLRQNRPKDAETLLLAWQAAGHQDTDTLALLSQAYAQEGQAAEAAETLRMAGASAQSDPTSLTRLASLALREGDAGLAAEQLQLVLDKTNPARLADASNSTAPVAPPQSRADTAAALVVSLLRSGQADKAALALEQLREAHGDAQQVDLLTGAVKLAQFDLAGARAAFESAHARDPASLPPLLDLSRVMAMQGDQAGAATLLKAALDKQPTNPPVLTAFVELALARKAPDEAIAAAEAAHKAAPADAGITTGLAELYLRIGHADQALSLIGGLPTDAAQTLALRADAERELGHMDEAIAAWQALLAKQPQDVALRHRIIGFLLAAKRYDVAQPLLDDGLAQHPGDAALSADAVSLAVGKDGLDAGIARAETLASHSTSLPILLLKGDLLMAARKYPEAAHAFADVRDQLPKDAKPEEGDVLVLRQVTAMNGAGDKDGGVKLLRTWLAAHPDQPAIEEALAENVLASGDLKGAREQFAAIIKRQPNNAAALNNLAWTEQQLGDIDDALTHARHAYTVAPGPQTSDTLGWILLADKRPADALVLLREAQARQPGDPSIQYHLASALKENGQDDAARAILQPVVDGKAPFGERAQAEALMQSLGKP